MSELRNPKSDWRTPTTNTAQVRYTREQLLSQFHHADPPSFTVDPELIQPMLAPSQEVPVFAGALPFTHELGPLVNSRRPAPKREPQEKLPEWFTEEHSLPHQPVLQRKLDSAPPEPTSPAKPADVPKKLVFIDKAKIKNLPESYHSVEQEYSHIDSLMEERLKQVIDEDEEMPEWDDPGSPGDTSSSQEMLGPVRYIPNFLDIQSRQGNPFATIIIENSTYDNTGALCPRPYSRPFEKIWHYKDPQGKVQGPFSSIQMFNWMAAGYFKEDLPIANSSTTHFAPLYMYVMQAKGSHKQADAEATSALKSMLGLASPARPK